MNKKPSACLDATLFPSPVLITERKEEFSELHAALTQELAPRNIVEKLFVADIANLVWEMRRLRRSKTAILDMASTGDAPAKGATRNCRLPRELCQSGADGFKLPHQGYACD
jgi:hypothetical protein